MWLTNPLYGIIAVAVALSVAVGFAASVRYLGLVSGEVARKMVHVQLGLVVACFPWLFVDRWPVWCLAMVAVFALAAVRWIPRLRRGLGSSLHDIERLSWGEFCFPIAAAVAWSLAPGDWIRFSLPMLVLAVSDAVAALVGTWYGRMQYSAAGGRKSWEGSLGFAAATFIVVHVPLLLFTPIGRADSLLIACNMAILLMLVEALAWEGFDNLFIPIAGVLLIDECIGLPLSELIEGTVVIVMLAFGSWWWRRRTTLDDAGVLACAVLGFVIWSAGGWLWLVAPTTVFICYALFFPPIDKTRNHQSIIPISIVLSGLVWLLADTRAHGEPRWVLAAAGAYAIHLGVIGLMNEAHRRPQVSWYWLVPCIWSLMVICIVLPTAIMLNGTPFLELWRLLLTISCGVLFGLILFLLITPDRRALPIDHRRWFLQCLLAIAGSSAVLIFP